MNGFLTGVADYAAPEVLQGKSYKGMEQDVWALGVLLYTICYKENPFYNVGSLHSLRSHRCIANSPIRLTRSWIANCGFRSSCRTSHST